MTTLSLSADAPFDDEESFLEFIGLNEIAHQTIARFLQKFGIPISRVPLLASPLSNSDWLLDHWALHQAEGRALGIPVPDLSAVDFSDEQQYLDWMRSHAALHEAENLALGIFT